MTRTLPRLCLRLLTTAATLLPAGCSIVGIRTTEEAPYRVLLAEDDVELREYEELVVVETVVQGDFDDAGDDAFWRLFGYISGDNATAAELAMTAPVLAGAAEPDAPAGQRFAMTSPVVGAPQGDGWRYAFVLPSEVTWATAPAPTDPDVRLALVPSARVAALRYSGFWSEAAWREKSAELQAWIAANGLVAVSPPRGAGYDPPWTLPFLRRNEVLIDVE